MTENLINPFYKKEEEYKRDFYPLKHYINQTASYLQTMTGDDFDTCKKWLIDKLRKNELGNYNDPTVSYLYRGDNYDRELVEQKLTVLLKDIIQNKELMAPSLTTYVNEEVEKSMVSASINENIKKRNVAKKAMFAFEAEESRAKEAGDIIAAEQFHSNWFFSEKTQAATKISNNSVSGMHNSAANPFFNPSSHSSLTSNCRITSGFGNANNEKLLTGNRHYWSPTVTLCNIISIVTHTDYKKLGKFIRENNFYLPTCEDVINVIEYSSNLYWKNRKEKQNIVNYVNKLNPLQRAAFVYTGDLYHIRKYNEGYVRNFIKRLSTKIVDDTPRTAKDMKNLLEEHVLWAHHICMQEMRGKGVKYSIIENTTELATLYATALNISQTLHDHRDFIDVFLMTNNVPASVPRFPDSIRRAALISDTDSTIFTVQEWQKWFTGDYSFSQEATSVATSMIAIANESIAHVLAIMCANSGISKEKLRLVGMKNEYYFPVIVPTRVAKHYFGSMTVQEGNVKQHTEYEIKGVHLKSSNAPKYVNDMAKAMMVEILDTTMRGEKISIKKLLNDVAVIENKVLKSLLTGEGTFYRRGQIQTLDSYKRSDTPELTNYFQFMLWQEVFAPKYGNIEPPPYRVYKLSTNIKSATLTKKWLDELEDQELATRMRNFMAKYNKSSFTTFWLPQSYMNQYGLPKELQEAIGVRHMVADVCKVFYIILETLGYYGLNSKETNLTMDYYSCDKPEEDIILKVSSFIEENNEVIIENDEDTEYDASEVDEEVEY